ncbi:MAG: GNAT family N-acetyltransferase [Pseudomonadota bacterium]
MDEVAEAAFAPYVPVIGKRPAPMDEDRRSAIASDEALVAVFDGVVAGYAIYRLAVPDAELITVAVDPKMQRQGLGRALMGAVEDKARGAGATTLNLYTNAKMLENLALYPALGFAEIGRRYEAGFNRVYFSKTLPPAMVLRQPVAGLFGRRRGKAGPRLDPTDPLLLDLANPFAPELVEGSKRCRLEVGFGGGEHLLHHAEQQTDCAIIGVEPYETLLARTIRTTHDRGLANLRFYGGDARDVLTWLPAGILDRVDVLFPDPWPKQKHWKRRFISAHGLDLLAHALRPGGTVRFASDIASYVHWTRSHVKAHGSFELTGDSETPWPHWPGTRYEAKARREGRPSRYLTFEHRPNPNG